MLLDFIKSIILVRHVQQSALLVQSVQSVRYALIRIVIFLTTAHVLQVIMTLESIFAKLVTQAVQLALI